MEITYTSGTPAQGNTKPPELFDSHALAVVNGVFYDPSYGQTYSSMQDMENKVIDGYYRIPDNLPGTVWLKRKDKVVGIEVKPDPKGQWSNY